MPATLDLAALSQDQLTELVRQVRASGLAKLPKGKPAPMCVRSPITGCCTTCGDVRQPSVPVECPGEGASLTMVSNAHVRSIINR